MRTCGFTAHQIQNAAKQSSVELRNFTSLDYPLATEGKNFQFTLAPKGERYVRWNKSWSSDWRRIGGKVCYHGHFAFMHRLFKKNPLGTIHSGRYGKMDYIGLDGFMENAPEMAEVNMAAPIEGERPYRDYCKCETELYMDEPWVTEVTRHLW
jgi:hypothetical protein